MRRISLISVALAACLVLLVGAPTSEAHVLTAGTANAIAERFSRQVAERSAWAEEWSSECSRETPWTFSCNAQLGNSGPKGVWCWIPFNVVQPNLGVWGRPRIEDRQPPECEPNAE